MCRTTIILAVSLTLCLPTGCSLTKQASEPTRQTQDEPSKKLSQTQQSPETPVRLNYIYLALDPETLDAISQSPFICESFALYGQSLPASTSGEGKATTYLVGEGTCIEFLPASAQSLESEGDAGICFSTRRKGQIDTVYDTLRAKLGSNVHKGMTRFDTGDERIPWFHFVNSHPAGTTPPLLTWVTEHDPEFYEVVGPDSKYRDPRSADSYSEPLKLFRKTLSLTLDLTQPEFDHLNAELLAYGYIKEQRHGLTVFKSADTEIRAAVLPNPEYRIRSIRCSLAGRPEETTKLTFGDKATLTLTENANAIWTFGGRQTSFVRN